MTDAGLIERAEAAPGDAAAARRLLPLLALTDLDGSADAAAIERLCADAVTHGVAAVRLDPRWLELARERLEGRVRLATVANFPQGGADIARAAEEVAAAVAAGAEEVGVVAPLEALAEGDIGLVTDMVEACRTAAGPGATFAVILETGVLKDPPAITAAARAAIMGGCEVLATSTGTTRVGATLEAAAVMLRVLEEAGGRVGFEATGGIRTAADAAGYLYLADELLGRRWVSPATFRIGASSLLRDLLRVLGR
jgi:deoxyribose-phosphate aldolase